MLSVTNKSIMLNVVMLSVVMLNVVAPFNKIDDWGQSYKTIFFTLLQK
jgi:hypothetical protein